MTQSIFSTANGALRCSLRFALFFAIIVLLTVSRGQAQPMPTPTPQGTQTPPPPPAQPTMAAYWNVLKNSSAQTNYIQPAIVARTANNPLTNALEDNLDVYAVADDGTTGVISESEVCRSRSGHPICRPTFGTWTNLGGVTYNSPAAVGWGTHREAFVIGTNNNLYHNYTDNQTWSGWQSLGAPTGGICVSLSAVSWAADRIDVFAKGCSSSPGTGNLWHTWMINGSWQGWEEVPGGPIVNVSPALAPAPGVIELAAIDNNYNVEDIECHDSVCDNSNSSWKVDDDVTPFCSEFPAVQAPSPSLAGSPVYGHAIIQPCVGVYELSGVNGRFGVSWEAGQSFKADVGYNSLQISTGLSPNVYFRDTAGNIEYAQFQTSSGWTSGYTLGSDTFVTNPVSVTGVEADWLVAVKSDGTVWYAYAP